MPPAPNPLFSFIPVIIVFVIFYVLMVRPQQQQQREHKKMLEALKRGDRVLTTGGLYGTVVGFRGEDVELKLSDNVKVLLARSAVTKVLPGEGAPKPAALPAGAAS